VILFLIKLLNLRNDKMAKPNYNYNKQQGQNMTNQTNDTITNTVVVEPVVTTEEVIVKTTNTTVVEQTAAPVVLEPVVTTTLQTDVPVQSSNIDLNVTHMLEQYFNEMKPGKPIQGDIGGKLQYGLWLNIKNILATSDKISFSVKFNTLLSFANKHRTGLFSENYLFRFPEHWVGSDAEFTSFRHILHVIISTCDNSNRVNGLKEINMEKALEGFNEQEKSNIISFYNL